jgi:hypothetical protein
LLSATTFDVLRGADLDDAGSDLFDNRREACDDSRLPTHRCGIDGDGSFRFLNFLGGQRRDESGKNEGSGEARKRWIHGKFAMGQMGKLRVQERTEI